MCCLWHPKNIPGSLEVINVDISAEGRRTKTALGSLQLRKARCCGVPGPKELKW